VTGAERWLFVSNGHGEDHVGAMLAGALRSRRPDLELAALPLVGTGSAYAAAGVDLLDPRARLPSGGLTMHAPSLLWSDLRAGLVRLTLAQCRALRRAEARHVVVVGDVYAHALASLVDAPRSVVQTLVSVHMRVPGRVPLGPRRFMEGIHGVERRLMRGRVLAVYPRDGDTAAWLRARGVAHARWLGNPMMDGVHGGRPIAGLTGRRVVALLPGSREHAFTSVALMLDALTASGPIVGLVAWTHDAVPPPPPGWLSVERAERGLLAAWRHRDAEVWWLAERFPDVLASAQGALGTTGTAQEQAAGLGLPVVTFVQPPLHGHAFVANQQRLLGPALRIVAADAAAVAGAVVAALEPGSHRRDAEREGPARMGPAGAAGRIADDLIAAVAAAGADRAPARARP
jgi:uncharacterized protein (TIGR03492 family)